MDQDWRSCVTLTKCFYSQGIITIRNRHYTMTVESGDLGRGSNQLVDDALRELIEIREGFKEWFASGGAPYELVDDRNCACHLHFAWKIERQAAPLDFCALWQWPIGNVDHEIAQAVGEKEVNFQRGYGIDRSVQQAVLVPIPHFIENVEWVGRIVRPKRLQSIDDCERLRIYALDHSVESALVFCLFPEDGESRNPFLRHATIVRDEFPNDVVKGGTGLMDNLTSHDSPPHRSFIGSCEDDQFLALIIDPVSNLTSVMFSGIDLFPQQFEVELSPVKFGLSTHAYRISPHEAYSDHERRETDTEDAEGTRDSGSQAHRVPSHLKKVVKAKA